MSCWLGGVHLEVELWERGAPSLQLAPGAAAFQAVAKVVWGLRAAGADLSDTCRGGRGGGGAMFQWFQEEVVQWFQQEVVQWFAEYVVVQWFQTQGPVILPVVR